ncbi:MAG: GIY-YIG nuclease family protein [Chloroflexi bacterium]|nr:GIY-YIG nuclease family protein [Chloroflexota bacterium]
MHLACWNRRTQPLDDFVNSKEKWESWQRYRGERDDFNRKYIFAMMEFYHESDDIWLFGGIYEVIARSSKGYRVRVVDGSKELIGRLKICFKRPGRVRAVKFEKYYNKLVVSEILKESYTGQQFCGYENINHGFPSIENIIKTDRPDWKAALTSVKGVYLITDKENGKRYVGSAYGDSGVWSRWACYAGTGHGWNDELTKLIKEKGIEYARSNFVFTLLEYRSMKADDKSILEREKYWKEVLLAREYGYNKN